MGRLKEYTEIYYFDVKVICLALAMNILLSLTGIYSMGCASAIGVSVLVIGSLYLIGSIADTIFFNIDYSSMPFNIAITLSIVPEYFIVNLILSKFSMNISVLNYSLILLSVVLSYVIHTIIELYKEVD